VNITPNGTFLWILPNPASRLNAAPIYSSKEVKVFFGLLRMKVDAARPKIATIVSTILLTSLFVSIPVPAKAAACSPTTTSSNGETILTFASIGNCDWTVPAGVTSVRVLVVGGGSSGGAGVAGVWWPQGGGGGAVVANSTFSVIPSAVVAVSVGAGGAAINTQGATSTSVNNGGQSSFATITANGGSAPNNSLSLGGTSGNGNTGGSTAGGYSSGGGGGAGGVGSGMTGGVGVNSDISGATVMYGSGGAGANGGSGTASSGGGSNDNPPTANRGGGGSQPTSYSGLASAGASGVVIIRYSVFLECSPTETAASNGDTILTFSTLGNCNWEVPTGVGLLRTLVVGGGGAGGGGYTANFFGNGGGGGEVLDSPAVATPGEVIAISVGSGGAATNYNANSTASNNGQNSNFGSIVARGGSSTVNRTTRVGGASGNLNTGGTGTNASGGATEGGGGAGSGANGSGRNGGAGVTSNISGTATQYGGGGASMGFVSVPVYGTATGGGGIPATYNTNVKGNATANTGGGGGGDNGVAGGGAGGSGVVIVRYSTATSTNTPTCASTVGFGGVAGVTTNQAGHGCVIIAYTVSGSITYQTFNYTGADQSWTSPASTTTLTFYLVGAGGGAMNAAGRGNGASGGFATGTYSAASSTVFKIIVGQGGNGTEHTLNTYGGGGKADYGSGGGRSAIRVGVETEDLITAGGGGGGGYDAKCGGAGGGTTGQDAVIRTSNGEHGKGATQTAGGAGGYSVNNRTGGTGVKYQGGLGRDDSGGGGGGYWGGGGGGDNIGAGGGSGYFNPSLINDASLVQGTCASPGSSSALSFAITYDGNGSTAGNRPASQAVKAFSSTTLATNAGNLAKTGFTFAGWNTAANGTGTNYASGALYSASRGITLYAQWNSTITYNTNGATGTVPTAVSTTTEASRTFVLNAGTGLTRTNLVFAGWNTSADGSGTHYAGGASYTSTGNATLFAIFRPLYTYNANGATSGTVPAPAYGPVPGTQCVTDPGFNNCRVISYTGTNQTFTVPSDIDATKGIMVEAWGAGGAGSVAYYGDPSGGAGGYSKAKINTIAAGDVLTVIVGQGGLVRDTTTQFGGGGAGGVSSNGGSSGGGYSGVFSGTGTSTPILISGGGGAASPGSAIDGQAGGGGAASNDSAIQNGGQSSTASVGGRGGTGTAGGAGATANASCATAGSSLMGGNGCGVAGSEAGSGGGGGYFGGGGGTYQTSTSGTPNGGGGGGSGYLNTSLATSLAAVKGPNGVFANFAYPDRTSPNYALNAGRGGKPNTNTIADNTGGNGLITIQWSSTTSAFAVSENTGNLSRLGYVFAGWNTAANGSGTSVSPGSSFPGSVSTTLYAAWTPSNTGLTPSFNTNTSTPIGVLKSTAYTINSEYTGTSNDLILSQYADKIQIVASVPSGTLSITTTANLTLPIGYQTTLTTAASTVSFIGDLAAVNAALASLKYTAPTTAVITTITITASYAGLNGDYRYNPVTGSYYWRGATAVVRQAALDATTTSDNCGVTFNGMCGYMTIPNNADESLYIVQKLGIGWIGLSKLTASTLQYVPNAPPGLPTPPFTFWSPGEGRLSNEQNIGIRFTTGMWADLSTQSENPIYEFGGKSETPIFAPLTRTIAIAPNVTVTYLANGGTGTVPSPLTGLGGSTLRAAANTGNLAKTGLTFAGWNTKADGTGVTYVPNGSFTTATSISLYAMYLAACTPTKTSSGGYVVLTFTGAGNCLWTTPSGVTSIDLLTVGAGGGGAGNLGGGGGGGQVVYQTGLIPIGTAVVTVGAGGAGGVGQYNVTTNHGKTGVRSGFVSSTLNQIALGGSGGKGRLNATNLNPDGTPISSGWTGGGAAYQDSTAQITPDPGVGGDSVLGGAGSYNGGGGGGGAGGVGIGTNATSNAGAGGPGVSNSISGTATNYGGGGGTALYGTNAKWTGLGGIGGGANATRTGVGTAGAANTGGGGSSGYTQGGGAGGTGVVILRYAFGTPSAPTITSITGTANKLTVAFTPPTSDGGSAITNYEYSLDGGATWTTISSTDAVSPIEITKLATGATLTNGTTYQVAIRALNGKTGLTSNVVAGTTPLSPPTISAVAGNAQATITVGAAVGESPTSFTVTALDNSGVALSPAKTCTVTAPATSCVITGLTNGTTYKFSAVANLGGQSSTATTTATGVAPAAPIVTYNANSGTVGPSSTSTLDIAFNAGTPVVHPLPVRAGYNFTGWFNSSNTLVGQDGSNYEPAATITLTAGWAGVTYSISYNGNGNTGGTVPATGSFVNGSASPYVIVANTGSLTKTGYTFDSWVDGSGTTISGDYLTPADLQLFAKWTPVQFTVSYNTADGGTAPANQNYTYGTTGLTIDSGSSLTKSGYTFLGWSKTTTGTTVSSPFIPTENTILYARWAGSTFAVAFNSNGGSISPATAYFTTGGAAITLPSAGTQEGYFFEGWSDTLNGNLVQSPYTATSNITLYAKWTPILYNITYNRGVIGSTTLTTGQPVVFPSNATSTISTSIQLDSTIDTSTVLSGTTYVFTGWKESGTNSVYKGGDSYRMPAADVSFTAQWVAVYTVSYILNGGTGAVPADVTQTDGSPATLTSVIPTRVGYTFSKWVDQKGLDVTTSFTVNAGRYLLYAVWTPDVYTITYVPGASATGTVTATTGGYKESVTLGLDTTLTYANFKFVGWKIGTIVYSAGGNYVLTANVNAEAQWESTLSQIFYDINGGTGTAAPTVAAQDQPVTLLTAGTFSRSGYAFTGWIGGGQTSPVTTFTNSTTNSVTLIAKWTLLPPGIPSAPTALAGSGSATVTVNPSTSGGAADSFLITASNGSTCRVDAPSTSCVITGLTDGQSYTFTTTATNSAGSATASGASNSVTPAGKPGIVTGVLATAGSGNAAVRFTAPANTGGAAITSYTVTASTGQTCVITPTPNFPDPLGCTVNNLVNGTAITFVVQANNGVFTSDSSTATMAVTPATISAAPTAVNATSTAPGKAIVTFTAPTDSGGSAIIEYIVTSSPGGLTCLTTNSANGCEISGLTNGTPYTFTVVAKNGVGNSPPSLPSTAVTPVGKPSTPTNIVASPSNKSATVNFTAPNTGGSPITKYDIEAFDENGIAFSPALTCTLVVPFPTPLACKFEGTLTNGLKYTFKVSASNAIGSSGTSTATTAITPDNLIAPTADRIATPTGDLLINSMLTASATFGGSPVPTVTFVWQRCTTSAATSCTTITGETADTYTTTSADEGFFIRYRATGTNTAGTAVGFSDTTQAITTTPEIATPTSGITGTTGTAFSLNLAVTRGAEPYTFAITTGTLQTGLALGPNTGTISGTPTTAGSSAITIQVTDAKGKVASTTFIISIVVANSNLTPDPAPTCNVFCQLALARAAADKIAADAAAKIAADKATADAAAKTKSDTDATTASTKAAADAVAAATAAKAAVDKTAAAAVAQIAADAAAKAAAAAAKTAADAQAAATKAAADAQAALKNSTTTAATKAAATKSANNAAAAATAAVKAAATAAQKATTAKTAASNAKKQVDIAINSLTSRTAAAQTTAQANAIAAAAKAAANAAARAAANAATTAKANATVAQKAASDAAARIATEQKLAADAAALAQVAADAALKATTDKIAADAVVTKAAQELATVLAEKAALAEQAAKATDETARAEIQKKIEEVTKKVEEAQKASDTANTNADAAARVQTTANQAAEAATKEAQVRAAQAVAVKAESAAKTAAATKAVTAATVAVKVAEAAKAAAAKVPAKAVIATKPSTSTNKNSAKATVTGLKPGQKVKVTVNVRPKP
jgi:uncharacterized repeat protein (TIGR02543 family)